MEIEFGCSLKQLRKRKGMTLKELGEWIGVAESTVSLYESGKREPKYEIVAKIAEFFSVSIDYLFGIDKKIENLRCMNQIVIGGEMMNGLGEILYTVKEVSKLIKCNPAYVYELINNGLLPALKLGSLKVRRTALNEFLQKYEGKDLTDIDNIVELKIRSLTVDR